LEEYHSWLPFLSAVIRKPDSGIHRFPLYGKESFKVLRPDYPPAVALKHDELDERGHLVEPAEKPDKKDDRDRYADQPEQKTSTQGCLLRFAGCASQRRI
jgi:hypothetical protein